MTDTNVSNWPTPTTEPVSALTFHWTDTHSMILSQDGIFTISINETSLAHMAEIPEFVRLSKDLPGVIKLNLAGLEELEEAIQSAKAALRGDAPTTARLYISHFE